TPPRAHGALPTRRPPGPGRAFTPTRGSLVVITHVALEVKGSTKPSANPERV
ncbi:hypothetical protein BE221DRAFT_193821, partial [Ostreococcus tauri]